LRFNQLPQWLDYLEQRYLSVSGTTQEKTLQPLHAIATHLNLYPKSTTTVITVTGTNGKGSCVEMLMNVYHDAGYRVATYTSPHCFSFNERIRLDGMPVTNEKLCEAFEIIENTVQKKNNILTFFEFITLAALWIFKQANIQVMILEVGIGGRLDATNIIDAHLAIIASIGLDHMALLGSTRDAIATEKAGILRQNQLAVCGDLAPPDSLLAIAKVLNVNMSLMGKDFFYDPIQLPSPILLPNNAAVAFQTISLLQHKLPINLDQAAQSIIKTRLPGRCERYILPSGAIVIRDVAHNPSALALLRQELSQYHQHHTKKIIAFCSFLNDKDIIGNLAVLKDIIDEWHMGIIHEPRGATREQLESACAVHYITPIWHDDLKKAIVELKKRWTANDVIVIFGSFRVVFE